MRGETTAPRPQVNGMREKPLARLLSSVTSATWARMMTMLPLSSPACATDGTGQHGQEPTRRGQSHGVHATNGYKNTAYCYNYYMVMMVHIFGLAARRQVVQYFSARIYVAYEPLAGQQRPARTSWTRRTRLKRHMHQTCPRPHTAFSQSGHPSCPAAQHDTIAHCHTENHG